ncbi:MAG: hypothetical protein VR67_17740 [Peptococcaceae bacterium BRH_c8a]|nr:MAG: hypothetical protein VR67_17740 [Peptococcaceae bacterium BRH_c8a]
MKSYQFLINDYLIGWRMAIREKADIILLLINTIRYLNYLTLDKLETVPNADIQLIIHVDKMSRILLCKEEKIHTFQFPFLISEEDNKLVVYYKGRDLDSKVSSIISTIFKKSVLFNESIDSMFDLYLDAMREYEITDNLQSDFCWDLVMHLLSFEPGYLRYDYDYDREDDILHPLNHLDFYYTNNNTFKIGLNGSINNNDLIRLLDINQHCKYLR